MGPPALPLTTLPSLCPHSPPVPILTLLCSLDEDEKAAVDLYTQFCNLRPAIHFDKVMSMLSADPDSSDDSDGSDGADESVSDEQAAEKAAERLLRVRVMRNFLNEASLVIRRSCLHV